MSPCANALRFQAGSTGSADDAATRKIATHRRFMSISSGMQARPEAVRACYTQDCLNMSTRRNPHRANRQCAGRTDTVADDLAQAASRVRPPKNSARSTSAPSRSFAHSFRLTQIPITEVAAPPPTIARGFVPWRLSDAGHRVVAPSSMAGIRNPAQERPYSCTAQRAARCGLMHCSKHHHYSITSPARASSPGESQPKCVCSPEVDQELELDDISRSPGPRPPAGCIPGQGSRRAVSGQTPMAKRGWLSENGSGDDGSGRRRRGPSTRPADAHGGAAISPQFAPIRNQLRALTFGDGPRMQ